MTDRKRCDKCDKEFSSIHAVQRHQQTKRCIGMWYVCKRCVEPFDTISLIRAHRCTKRVGFGDNKNKGLDRLKIQRGIDDNNGDVIEYYRSVIKRSNENEVTMLLQTLSFDELKQFIQIIDETDTFAVLGLLSTLATFVNDHESSPERVAYIQPFILRKTAL